MYRCTTCKVDFSRSRNFKQHQQKSCPAFGKRKTEFCATCGKGHYRSDTRKRHEAICRGAAHGLAHSEQAHVLPHHLGAACSQGQNQSEYVSTLARDLLEVFVGQGEELALEASSRRQAAAQAPDPTQKPLLELPQG